MTLKPDRLLRPGHEGSARPSVNTPWWLIAWAAGGTLLFWPVAAGFYTPTAVGYVQFPGVCIFLLLASVSTICFLHCPLRRVWAKVTLLLITTNAAFWAVYSGACPRRLCFQYLGASIRWAYLQKANGLSGIGSLRASCPTSWLPTPATPTLLL